MGTPSQPSTDPDKVPANSTAVLIFATMADVTWRLFVPTIGLTVIGIVADHHWDTRPWCTVSGVVLGTVSSFLLVRQQLKKVKATS